MHGMGCWNKSINKFRHSTSLSRRDRIDASITHSPRKPKTKLSYEVINDREERDDESDAQAAMRVIEVVQPGVDAEVRWVKKAVSRFLAINSTRWLMTMA